MKCSAKLLQFPYWVLIVDDEVILTDAYEKIIERAGGRPISVGKSNDAKLVLKNKHIDVVLLDFRIPIGDSMYLLKWLHSCTAIQPAIVILSNHDNPDDISKAYELGADRYVLKARASPNDLINVLNETFENSINTSHSLQLQR